MSGITRAVDWLSGQWILDWFGTNGGEVVVIRSIFIFVWFTPLALGVQALVDPERSGPLTLLGLQSQLAAMAAWLSAFFGACYLALYARFVSQWSYLANVYNQIKQAESAQGANRQAIAEWKAGFLEDADHLHLVEKKSLAPIIANWGTTQVVISAFNASTPGGQPRLDRIVNSAKKVCAATAAAEQSKSR